MVRVQRVTPLDAYKVRLRFTDGTDRVVDLEPYLHGEVFREIKNNPNLFRSVKVDKELGTIVWDNGADIDPDVLYHGRTPAWMERRKKRA